MRYGTDPNAFWEVGVMNINTLSGNSPISNLCGYESSFSACLYNTPAVATT